MKGFTVWFTGLPSSGKSTLAHLLEGALRGRGLGAVVLDGDEVRRYLTRDLGYSKEDRDTNIRRIAYVAKAVTQAGGVAIACAISPYRALREEARRLIGRFVEVYVSCPVEVCRERDVKGLYAQALRGEIANFTGVSDPYEPPENPEVVVETHRETPQACLAKILGFLEAEGYLEVGEEEEEEAFREVRLPAYLADALEAQAERQGLGLSEHVIRLLVPHLDLDEDEGSTPALDEGEVEAIKDRLRNLGYLD